MLLRKVILVFLFYLLGCPSVYASLANKIYIRGEVGQIKSDKLDSSLKFFEIGEKYPISTKPKSNVYSLGLGYQFTDFLRSDISLSQTKKFRYFIQKHAEYMHTHSYKSTVLLFNTYLSAPTKGAIIPYVSMALGRAWNQTDSYLYYTNNIETFEVKGRQNQNLAKSVGTGLSISLSGRAKLDINYKYYDLGKIKTSSDVFIKNPVAAALLGTSRTSVSPIQSRIKAHTINIGLRVYM